MHFPELFYGYFYIPCWTVLEILNLQNLKLVVLTHICKAKSPSQRDFTKYIGRLISKFILQKLPQVILMSANDASSRLCRPALNATQKRCCCSVWGGYFYFWLYLNAAHSSWSRLPSYNLSKKQSNSVASFPSYIIFRFTLNS